MYRKVGFVVLRKKVWYIPKSGQTCRLWSCSLHVLDLLCVVCQHGCLEKVCTLQLSNLRQRVLELRLGFVVSARFCVYDFCMNARLHHFLINILQVLICDIYRHGMSLRKNYDQGVYGITHTKQLCIRKPVKYEYKYVPPFLSVSSKSSPFGNFLLHNILW